jgi:hypothetical protein
VTASRRLEVTGLDGREAVSCDLATLERAWRHPLEGVV